MSSPMAYTGTHGLHYPHLGHEEFRLGRDELRVRGLPFFQRGVAVLRAPPLPAEESAAKQDETGKENITYTSHLSHLKRMFVI